MCTGYQRKYDSKKREQGRKKDIIQRQTCRQKTKTSEKREKHAFSTQRKAKV